ncbi:MAG: hypothetical protein AB7F89_24375, partial [Pirellulaceae bacterium]
MLLENLEARQLLAVGPRLAGVQPNNSDIFSFTDASANVRHVAPHELTLRFDESQVIDPASLSGIRITQSGFDGLFGNANDRVITPGFIGVEKSPAQNEVVIRFAEALPDDVYTIEILGAGNATPLRNVGGDAYIPTLADNDGDASKDTVRFELDLGPQVVAVVPQPITRNLQGALVQARNQIQVYFDNDDLFLENDDLGNPTQASAENPNFYQLIFTRDTVANTDDVIVKPSRVEYDPGANLVTLTFPQDLDQLLDPNTGALIGPGTFRLRVGTDEAAPLAPQRLEPTQLVSSDFGTGDQVVLQFLGVRPGENDVRLEVTSHDLGTSTRVRVNVVGQLILLDLNNNPGATATAQDVVQAVNQHSVASQLVAARVSVGNASTAVGNRLAAGQLLQLALSGQGDSYDTATNLADNTDVGPVIVVTGSGSTFVDGQFFELTDTNGVRRKFEFDRDVPRAVNDPVSIAIPVDDNLSQASMARSLVAAINQASFGIRASLAGNRVRLEGDLLVDLAGTAAGLSKDFQNGFDNGQVLDVVRGGDSFTDGDTFQITAAGQTISFEFDEGLSLQLQANNAADITDQETCEITEGATTVVFEFVNTSVNNAANGNNVPIRYDATFTTRESLA